MPKFIFAYHGGKMAETPEEGAAQMALWQKWFETLGASVVDGGNPVGQSYTVSDSGVVGDGGANPVSGYTLVNADTIDAACEMAKGCPMVQTGTGSVEVAEAMEIDM